MKLAAPILAVLCVTYPLRAHGEDASVNSLFSSYEKLDFQLKAPFDDLFAKSARESGYAVDGVLSYTAPTGKPIVLDGVRLSVRGNTSKEETECRFPKLKLEFAAGPDHDASIFRDVTTLKIGTHCGEAADGQPLTRLGRLANEKAPIREAFIYRLLDVTGVTSLKARPARITYVYTGGSRTPLVRSAMVLEDISDAMKRLHATHEIKMEHFGSAKSDLAAADTVALTFAEAMIGNFDWCLRYTPDDEFRCDAKKPLWNIAVLTRDGGRGVPLMYDFDESGMVTGNHEWFVEVLNENFSPMKSQTEVEVLAQLQHVRSWFSRADLDAARRHFLGRKVEAFRALRESQIDDSGRQHIERYLTDFFASIETDEAFYRPVVLREDTTAYAAADGDRPACPLAGTAPIGTPVRETGARNGTRVQVQVLDALWHWTGHLKCDAIRRGPVWIDESALGTQYPQ
jgi:hypothetical protein